ncbi:MAG: LON peptidase substrate-binding domain-containing protein [bacterium]
MQTDQHKLEVALFPIPNVVAFPGVDLPLHVFEPRYRQLVHDCVETRRLLGVCHTVKTIHKPARQQTLEQALRSNQATYKPQDIFSAGPCEILDTTADGRIIANVAIDRRLLLVEEIQSLPYRIVACRTLQDNVSPESARSAALQSSINARMIDILGNEQPALTRILSDPDWIGSDPAIYSFKIFQYLRFDADVMQMILASQSAQTRLEMIWAILNPDDQLR